MRIPTAVVLQMFGGARAVNTLRVASACAIGQTVTIGADVYEVDSGAGVTAGRISVNCSAGGTKATGTITSNNTNVSDGDTVTIGSTVYRFKDTMAAAYDVQIGADADASLLNLIKAINGSGTAGTHYYTGTVAHTQVTAATSVTSNAFAVTAIYTGTGGNSIASTDTATTLSWGAATLASGASPTAGQFTTAFAAAVNASQTLGYGAERISANEVLIYSIKPKNMTLACSETLAGSNNAWAAANMHGGFVPEIKRQTVVSRAINATEVALETMHFALPFTPTKAVVQATESDGTIKAIDGAITLATGRVTVDLSGSTDLADGDIVTVVAAQ